MTDKDLLCNLADWVILKIEEDGILTKEVFWKKFKELHEEKEFIDERLEGVGFTNGWTIEYRDVTTNSKWEGNK